MRKQSFNLKKWLPLTGGINCLVLTLWPLALVQPGILTISFLLMCGLVGVSYYVEEN